MITATMTGANGSRVIVLGVTRANLDRLIAGDLIKVEAMTHPGFPEDLNIAIFFGETERSLVEQLRPLMSDETKLVAMPRDPSSRVS